MDRRRVLVLGATAALGTLAAACGPAGRAIKSAASSTSTTSGRSGATTTSTSRPSGAHKPKSKQTTTTSEATTTTTSPPETTTTSPPATTTTQGHGWPAIVEASALPVGGTHTFTFGSSSIHQGQPGILYRSSGSSIECLDLVCTHQGGTCAVVSSGLLQCPLHGSQFNLSDGSVVRGPAASPLAKGTVEIRSDGWVWYVGDA